MRATSKMEDGPAPASAAASAIDGSPNIAITLGEFVAARKEACRKTWPSRKTSGRPSAFAALARPRLAFLGLVREKRRWRNRAGRCRNGAFDERGDCFAGAAFFAADADRHGGFAIAEIILVLRPLSRCMYVLGIACRTIVPAPGYPGSDRSAQLFKGPSPATLGGFCATAVITLAYHSLATDARLLQGEDRQIALQGEDRQIAATVHLRTLHLRTLVLARED
jgi:hypothetical protein